ncbi:rod shape determining protein RodA [Phycicoccus badiiscoriae]|uniref:peptidoglycan glycosyltransferase n=1 Tax=Pedococcus badiiscoriae TaxID=642776 RepID=A0A852WGS1_9MICO|nr:rod shape-determining protein RodA [Pedococcus badiiscoriae]NYG05844.1 rod shape determining protein RodA [Pedococcus badiiscoriae]
MTRSRPGGTWSRASGGAALWGRSDWGLVVAALGLSLVGALLVWSATRHQAGSAYLVRHLFNTVLGVALAAAVTRTGYQLLRALAPLLYLVSVAGLVLVLTPVGSTVNGSHSWILLPGGFSVQPSEFAKVALCLGLAIILGERIDRQAEPDVRDLLLAVVVAAVPIGLVMLQPDLGSATVLGALAFGVIAVAGTPKRYLAAATAFVVAGVVVALTTPVLSAYQRDRLTAFANPQADPQGIGYQTRQVRIAIGSGGWQGQGLFEGRQTQGGFIPYQQTDFVFSVAGEELGFLGAAGLLVLLGFVVLRAVLVAARAQDAFGRLMASGVAVWFLFQVFENVGMNLGITPVTGLPLPFLSYGGSSMFACWLAVGLVNNAHVAAAGRR